MEALDEFRIRFRYSARSEDMRVFNLVRTGEMTVKEACRKIADNNGLDYVTQNQFLFNMEWLGYSEKGKHYV